MNSENQERIRSLLDSSDIENVRMALELCDVLLTEAGDLKALFGIEDVFDTEKLCASQAQYPHARLRYGWIVLKLLELSEPWVSELKVLDLSDCELIDIPSIILEQHRLEGLDLSFNGIQELPELSQMTALKWLRMVGNPVDVSAVLATVNKKDLDPELSLLSLAQVPKGYFRMGALQNDDQAYDEEYPSHFVRLSRDMLVMAEPVTQWLYELVMGSNPSGFKGYDRPVEQVTWHDAVRFANSLSELVGLNPVYAFEGDAVSCDWTSTGWRLPTEAEWEYLARGGAETLYAGSDNVDVVAWHYGNSGNRTQPVRQKQPNAFGLYDMSGNVWEWCWDKIEYNNDLQISGESLYSAGAVTDPKGPFNGSQRMARGGSWRSGAVLLRSSQRRMDLRVFRRLRQSNIPIQKSNGLGFRLLRHRL